jgi:hypothetical protein
MTIDDVLKYIALRNVEIAISMSKTIEYEIRLRLYGEYTALKNLEHHIIMETNPHNREDIRKFIEEGKME